MNKKQIFFFLLAVFALLNKAHSAAEAQNFTNISISTSNNLYVVVVHQDSLINLVRSVLVNYCLTSTGKVAVLRTLLSGVHNLKDYEGTEPVMLDALSGCGGSHEDIKLLTLLKESGASVNAQNRMSGNTPLHYVCKVKTSKNIAFFLVECGADLNILNHYGQTPLDSARATNNASALKIASWLRQKGAKTAKELAALQEQQEGQREQLLAQQRPAVSERHAHGLVLERVQQAQSLSELLNGPFLIPQQILLAPQETEVEPTGPVASYQETASLLEFDIALPEEDLVLGCNLFSESFFENI